MKVLIIVASRHGSTVGIADAIADALRATGIAAEVRPADDRVDPAGYGAVVIGSAVYLGRWLEPARDFIAHHADALARRPVWLFSSGPIGDPPKPASEPAEVPGLVAAVGARGHRLFTGRLSRSELGFGERVIVAAVGAPEGDYRDFAAIRAFAGEIAASLVPAGA